MEECQYDKNYIGSLRKTSPEQRRHRSSKKIYEDVRKKDHVKDILNQAKNMNHIEKPTVRNKLFIFGKTPQRKHYRNEETPKKEYFERKRVSTYHLSSTIFDHRPPPDKVPKLRTDLTLKSMIDRGSKTDKKLKSPSPQRMNENFNSRRVLIPELDSLQIKPVGIRIVTPEKQYRDLLTGKGYPNTYRSSIKIVNQLERKQTFQSSKKIVNPLKVGSNVACLNENTKKKLKTEQPNEDPSGHGISSVLKKYTSVSFYNQK